MNMAEQIKCPVCSEQALLVEPYRGGSSKLNCVRCGAFEIGDIAVQEITGWKNRQLANLSGWIREHQGTKITVSSLQSLASLRTPTVIEKANRLLNQLARTEPKPGAAIDITRKIELQSYEAAGFRSLKPALLSLPSDVAMRFVNPILLSWSWTQDFEELVYIISKYLIEEMGALAIDSNSDLVITPTGWAKIEALQYKESSSQVGFIAMWFDASMNEGWRAIDQGIRDSGYEPLRIDQKQHNNKIDDEIVAGIRRSKFLVADFTGHRGGVYFEAGLATGLGLPIVWLCRKDELEKTHFDTRQYNFIVWEPEKISELSTALKNRIEATIGRGPLHTAA